jgi:hydrogenase nickel incorporation protein HypA/HybF
VHELSITQSIVDAVVARMDGARISAVRLEIGRLSGIVPDSVRFCFDIVAGGTILEGASLRIDEPPGRVHCRTCNGDSELEDPFPLCPCGSADIEMLSGNELRIKSVEVA